MFDGFLSSSIPARFPRAPFLLGLIGILLCTGQFSHRAGAQVLLTPPARRQHLKHPNQQQLQARRAQFQPTQRRMLLAPRLAAPAASRPVTRLLIKLKPGVSDHTFATQFSAAALQDPTLHDVMVAAANKPLLRYVRRHPGIGWTTYEVPSPSALQPTLNALSKDPNVIHAEPDYRVLRLNFQPPNNHYWGVLDWEHTFAVWGLGDSDENSVLNDDSTQWNYSWSQEQVSALQAWSVYPGHYQTAAERMNLLQTDPARLPMVGDIDTGLDLTHPNFSYTGNPSGGITDTDVRNGGQLSIQFTRAFTGQSFDGYQGDDPTLAMDDYGHGTGTSGLIGAAPNTGANDAAFVAANPGITWDMLNEQVYPSQLPGLGFPAQIVEMKVADAEGDGSDSDVIDAMEYASADWTDPNTGITHPSPHCVILNMSLALDTTNYPQALQDAVDFCWAHGTLVVAAAGNDGSAAGGPGSNTPRYPARCDKVLTISATTYNFPAGGVPEQITTYSDYGDQIGVCAPGGDLQTYINSGGGGSGCCCGFGCGLSQLQELVMPFTLQPSYYTVLNDPTGSSADSEYAQLGFDGLYLGELPGTSFAAPQVVGLAALYASEHRITQSTPNAPQLIVNAIELGADGINGNPNGGYDTTYGWGRINAAATIQDLNNRAATVGGFIGRVRYIDTVVGNVNVTAKAASGGATYSASTDPDGLYHIANLPAAPGGTLYNVTTTVYGGTSTAQVKVMPGCDQLGINLTAIAPVVVKSFTLSPASVVGSLNSTATITMNLPVTSATTVKLSSNNAVATVPGSITIPAGSSSQTFTITTKSVSTKTSVILTATAGTSSKNATLTVLPFGVKTLTLSPTSVTGSLPALGTVSLQYAVNSGSITVSLSSSDTAAAQPVDSSGQPISSVTISAPNQTASFHIATYSVTSTTPVSIVASANGITKSATLNVQPIGVKTLTLSPTAVTGSQPALGTLSLQAPAPSGGLTASVSSSDSAAAQPVDSSGNPISSVTVAAGSSTATFHIATYSVNSTTPVAIVASLSGTTKSATLSVKPVSILSFALSPTTIIGGQSITGTITLAVTPTSPVTVTFSSNSAAIPAPASITIPAGSSTGTITIATNPVTVKTAVTLTAAANGTTKTARVNLNP
jgi:hypothetical protein